MVPFVSRHMKDKVIQSDIESMGVRGFSCKCLKSVPRMSILKTVKLV